MTQMLISVLVLVLIGYAAASSSYAVLCDSVFCRILDESNKEISSLRLIVDGGSCIPKFGSKADEICNSALTKFSLEAPIEDGDDKENEAIYDKKIDDLERQLDAPLHVLYLKQLALLREKALKLFKAGVVSEGTEYEAMAKADEMFRHEAEDATRQSPEWTYARDSTALKSALLDMASRSHKLVEEKLKAGRQTSQIMQYVSSLNQQIQAMQQQYMGGGSPWNVVMAYRVPETNINVQGTYQQGRANLQISCVSDESAPFLGPNGFVNGVSAGNVGLSFNINI